MDPPYGANEGLELTSASTEPTRASRETGTRASQKTGSRKVFSWPKKKKKVAIFSRDSEENYQWLQNLLQSKRFREHVKCRNPVYISDNSAFHTEVLDCNVAILYHTKNRGRINITNVPDSLYNEELKFLHEHLGKKKVVVLIDDLERSDEEEKRKIMERQKDLGRLAGEVLLFSQQDKHLIIDGRSKDSNVEQKLTTLKTIIKSKLK